LSVSGVVAVEKMKNGAEIDLGGLHESVGEVPETPSAIVEEASVAFASESAHTHDARES
jgi:hypothetical protein